LNNSRLAYLKNKEKMNIQSYLKNSKSEEGQVFDRLAQQAIIY
jgi:hypothetical protein